MVRVEWVYGLLLVRMLSAILLNYNVKDLGNHEDWRCHGKGRFGVCFTSLICFVGCCFIS
jgi:hypothetical protein